MTTNTQPQTQQSAGDELRKRLNILATRNYNNQYESIIADVDFLMQLIQARERAATAALLHKITEYVETSEGDTSSGQRTLTYLQGFAQLLPQAGEGGE